MVQAMTRGTSLAQQRAIFGGVELSQRWWKVGFTTGMRPSAHAQRRRRARVGGRGHRGRKEDVWTAAEAGDQLLRSRSGGVLAAPVFDRAGAHDYVEVGEHRSDRRAPRSKTDAVDLRGLLALLARYVVGDRRCGRVVRVPSVAEEDARQLHRTWETLQGDRTRMINRVKAVLATHGVQAGDHGRLSRGRGGHARLGWE